MINNRKRIIIISALGAAAVLPLRHLHYDDKQNKRR